MDFQALLNHHEAILQAHHSRFEEYKSWLKAQNTTPSIVPDPNLSVDVLNYEDVLGSTKGTPRKNENFQGPRSPLKDNQNLINSPAHQSPNSSMRRSPRQIKESVMNLHNQGKAYDAHKQELRAKREQEELSNCKPFTVNTDYQSHRRDSRPVHERLQAFDRERKARLEKQRKESILKDDPEASFKPQLSKKALALGHRDVIGQNAAWLELRRKRIEEAKTQQLNKELECVTNSPGINGRSQKIIARKQRQLSDPKPKEKTKDKILIEEAEKCPGTPKITAHAANLQRPGMVGDRLYEQWVERQEREKQDREQAVITSSQYSPHITKMASTLTRTRPVEDEILARHFLSQVKWEENRRQNETVSTYKPVINPVSNEIANRLPQSSVDRLTSNTSSRNNTPSPMSNGHQTSNNSLGSAPTSSVVQLEKVESLYLREERRRERLDYMRQQRNDDIMMECTFQPNVHRKSEPPPSAVQYYSQQPIYDRVIQWAKRREQRLEDERHKRKELDLEECTFNPDIRCISGRQYDTILMDDDIHSMHSGSTYSGMAISTTTSRTHNNTTITGTTESNPPWGYQEFIQRQNEARERREELQQKTELFQGHTWRNEITKPQPFQLGKPYTQPIKSLQPPTTPRSTSPTYSNKHNPHSSNSSILTALDNAGHNTIPSQGAFSLKATQFIMESTTPNNSSPYDAQNYFLPSSRTSSTSSPSTMERDLSLSEYISDSDDDAWPRF